MDWKRFVCDKQSKLVKYHDDFKKEVDEMVRDNQWDLVLNMVKNYVTEWVQVEFDDENRRMTAVILKNAATLSFYITICSCTQEKSRKVVKYLLKQGMISIEILIKWEYTYALNAEWKSAVQMVRELYYLKLNDEVYIDRSPAVGLYQKLLVLINMNEAEVRRRKSDWNIQDIETTILRQDVMVSEICTKFQNDEYDVVVEKAGKDWSRICLKDGDEFLPTKVMILQIFIEANIRGNTNDDMVDWIRILNQLVPNDFETAWLSLYYKMARNDEIEKEDIESVFDLLMADFTLDDFSKVDQMERFEFLRQLRKDRCNTTWKDKVQKNIDRNSCQRTLRPKKGMILP
jgi:hypothetical protein